MFIDGAIDDSGVVASDGLPVTNYDIGRVDNIAPIFGDNTISSFIAGAGIGFNQAEHNTNLRQLLTDLGVLP